MDTRLNVAGNPVYPILFMMPLGLLVTGIIFDVADLAGGPALLGLVAYWHLVVGIVAGACAGVALLMDLARTRPGSRARRTGVTHSLVNMGVLMVFAVVVMVRMREEHRGTTLGLLALEVAVLAGGICLARFGNRLWDRYVGSGRLAATAQRLGRDAWAAVVGGRFSHRPVGAHRS
jgi:uncharacterized membrane protein